MAEIEIQEEKTLIARRKSPGDNWILEIDKFGYGNFLQCHTRS